MKEKIEQYEKISTEMLDELENENYDQFDFLLRRRQQVIDEVCIEALNKFKSLYEKSSVKMIDLEMKAILDRKLIATKNEIKEYKHKVQGSNSYNDRKREKFNIFSKRV